MKQVARECLKVCSLFNYVLSEMTNRKDGWLLGQTSSIYIPHRKKGGTLDLNGGNSKTTKKCFAMTDNGNGNIKCGNCNKTIAKAYYGASAIGIEIKCRVCGSLNYISLPKDL